MPPAGCGGAGPGGFSRRLLGHAAPVRLGTIRSVPVSRVERARACARACARTPERHERLMLMMRIAKRRRRSRRALLALTIDGEGGVP